MTTLLLVALLAAPAAPQTDPGTGTAKVLDGKQIFLARNCDQCHSMESAGVQRTGKVKGPSLSGAAAGREAAWLADYLRKKADLEGKKHIKAFTGTDEELGALIAWLQTQKPAAK
jgi:mono/diheme cytochrome c family protein